MDDATLQAYLDGELPPHQARIVEHAADSLPQVARRLGQLAALERAVRSHLVTLDAPPDLDGAEERLLAAWRKRRLRGRPLVRRTAAVALLAAGLGGAVFAAEPLRSWLTSSNTPPAEVADLHGTDATDTGEAAAVAPTRGAERPAAVSTTALSVAALQGNLEIRLDGVAPGSPVTVERVEQGLPTLHASAAAAYRTGAGLLAMTGGHGPIVVGVPRGLQRVQLTVDGRLYLELAHDSLTLRAEGVELDGNDIRFVIREP